MRTMIAYYDEDDSGEADADEIMSVERVTLSR